MYEKLLENSIDAALSAIEIYNKPDFKYREQVFTILIINSWELLLKSKILLDNNNQLDSLYIPLSDGSFKKNRSGNSLTIEIKGAIKKLDIDKTLKENLMKFIEIRDTAIHFFHDESLAYAIYALGVASLKNYQRLINIWFDRSLLEYNFYIMPLGFAYNFQTLTSVDYKNKPEIVTNILNSISRTREKLSPSDYDFVCEVSTQFVSAKKFTSESPPDFVATIDKEIGPDTIIVHKFQRLTDKYPLTYYEVVDKVKASRPEVNLVQINRIIKEHKIKENEEFSAYSFRTKKQRELYEDSGILPSSISSIYNENAVRFIISQMG